MKHDELLELIAANEEFYDDGTNRTPSWSALRAIVELHKPIEQNLKYIPKLEFTVGCSSCWVEYPCPTIQAIEKELG